MKNNKNDVIDYEIALLGTIIKSNKAFDKAKEIILHSDFLDSKHQIIFLAIEKAVKQGYALEEKPIIKILKEENNFEKIGGEEYINYLISEAGLFKNITNYAKSIIEASRLREVHSKVKSILSKMDSEKISADEVLEKVEMEIISSARDTKVTEFKPVEEIVQTVIQEIHDKLSGKLVTGIKTDYKLLDKMTTGLHKGDLFILASRPSMGKTALALNIASNIAQDKNVAFFSVEMPSKQIINRLIGLMGFLPSYKIQDPKFMTESDKQKFTIATEKIKNLNFYIDDSPGIKLSELVWKAKRLNKTSKIDLIIIDYLQLISSSHSKNLNRQNEVAIISKTLKKLARELEIPVIALSQLSRQVEKRESKVPLMSDIRESGAIEQDADLIAFVYREAYYQSKVEKNENNDPQKVQIIISKHRNGPTGVVELLFNPNYGLFLDYDYSKEQK